MLEMLYRPLGDETDGFAIRAGWRFFGWFRGPNVDKEKDELNLLGHALIRSLEKPMVIAAGQSTAPSYVPADVFAKALLARVQERVTRRLRETVEKVMTEKMKSDVTKEEVEKVKALVGRLLTPSAEEPPFSEASLREQLKSCGADEVLVNALVPPLLTFQEARLDLYSAISLGLDAVPKTLKEALSPLLAEANGDLKALQAAIERWYDSAMDRATGWFKRRASTLVFGFALFVALLFSIDTFGVVRDLAHSEQARKLGVVLGNQIVDAGDATGGAVATQSAFLVAAKRKGWKHLPAEATASELRATAYQVIPLLVQHPRMAAQVTLAISTGTTTDAWTGKSNNNLETTREEISTLLCESHVQRLAASGDRRVVGVTPSPTDSKEKQSQLCEKDLTSYVKLKNAPNWKVLVQTLATSNEIFWRPELATVAVNVLAPSDDPVLKPAASASASAASASASAASAQTSDATSKQTTHSDFRKQLSSGVASAERATQTAGAFLSALPTIGFMAPGWQTIGQAIAWFFGCLVTALMVSLGAPFWYDMLSKLVNRRGTGPRPASSTAEG